jgi:hypothetical protein
LSTETWNQARLTQNPGQAVYLGTLAAAYANAGKFEEAAQWQNWAIKKFAADNDTEQKSVAETRLALFKEKKNFREPK